MTEVVVTTEAVRRAMLQSNRHHQQTNTQLLTGRISPVYSKKSPNQRCQSTEGKISHFTDLLTLSSPGFFHPCLWPLKARWLPWRGLPCLSTAL